MSDQEKLDLELQSVHKNTKTWLGFMMPWHHYLRSNISWYYRWHLTPYFVPVHIILLAIVFLSSGLLIGSHTKPLPSRGMSDVSSGTTLADKDASGVLDTKPGEVELIGERTESFKKFQGANNQYRIAGSLGPIHYRSDPFNDSEGYQEIDLTLLNNTKTKENDWDYYLDQNGYQIKIWNSKKTDKDAHYVARFTRAGESVAMAPATLMWENSAGQTQVIKTIQKDITPEIDNDSHTITWKNAFGTGIDFRYNINPDKFFKTVIVNNQTDLPVATIDTSGLKLTVVMGYSVTDVTAKNNFATVNKGKDLTIIYNPAKAKDEVLTNPTAFSFTDDLNRDLWWMQKPLSWDSSPNQKTFTMDWALERDGINNFMRLSTSATDINDPATTFPYYIDTAITEEQVGASSDDARVLGTTWPGTTTYGDTATGDSIGFVDPSYRTHGFRFTTVPIPASATINSSAISLCANSTYTTGGINWTMAAEAVDNSATFSSGHTPYNAYGNKTSATASWSMADGSAWTGGTFYASPSIASIVKEIVDRPGWVSNNNINILVYPSSSSETAWRPIRLWDYAGNVSGPKLNVTYTAGAVAPTVTTQAASGVGTTTATFNGTVTATGGANATVRGFKYSTVGEQDDSDTHDDGDFGAEAFTKAVSSLPSGTTVYARAYATNSAGTGYGSWVNFQTLDAVTISGTCKQYDQATNCADSETVKVAVNGVLQAQTGTTSSGSWSISGVTQPSAADVIIVFIDGVADDLEANALTVYDGTGDITDINLHERHLSIGSADNQTITNANLSQYDNSVSGDEDIFFDVDASNDLTVPYTGTQTSTDQEIIIKASNTYQPDSASSGNISTPNLEIATSATLTADGNTITLTASGTPLVKSGIFTYSTSTVKYTGTSATNITAADYYNLELKPTSGSPTYTFASGTINVGGNYINGDGTNAVTATADTNDPTFNIDGSFTNSASATFIASNSAAFSVASNFANSATAAFTHSSGSVTFDGQGVQSISTGGDPFNNVVISNTAAEVSQSDAATIAATLTVNASAIYDINGQNITLATLANNGTFRLQGGETTVTITNKDIDSGTIEYDGAGTYASLLYGATYYHLKISGAGSFTIAASTTATGNVYVSAGTLALGNNAYQLLITGSANLSGGTISIPDQGAYRTKLRATSYSQSGGTYYNGSFNYTDINGGFAVTSGTITQRGTLYISGDYAFSGGTLTNVGNAAVIFDGNTSAAINASSANFGVLQIDKGNTYTLTFNADITVGSFSKSATGSINTNGQTITFNADSGTFSGGDASYSNITVNANPLYLTGNATITGNMTLNSGKTVTYLSESRSTTFTDTGRLIFNASNNSIGSGIYGSYYLFQDDSVTNLPTIGTINAHIRLETATKDISVPARTYGKKVYFYNNGSTSRVATLGTAGSQTLIFSSDFIVNTTGSGGLTVAGNTWNPIVNITGNTSFIKSSSGVPSVTFGTGLWTALGNFDATNGALTTTGSTLLLNGSAVQTLTSASQSFNNLTSTNASAAGVVFADAATVSGTLTNTTALSKLTFNAGSTYTIGTLNFAGTSGNLITLASSSTSNWILNATTITQVTYVDVSYSTNSGTSFCATYSTGSNTTGWDVSASDGCVSAPTVTTQATSDIGQTDATLNGTITATGGGNATVRGFKYSSVGEQDDSDTHDTGDYGVATYSKLLESLIANTTYYVRAYAANSKGTGYGAWVQFTTSVPSITYSGSASSGAESVTSVNITVAVSDISGTNSQVDYAVTGGTATGTGTDYTLASGTATITAGSTSTNIVLTVVNDTLDENNETIIVTLANPTNATLGATTEYTYTITDDDAMPTVSYAAASGSYPESDTIVGLMVSLSTASGLASSVDYSVTGGTATGGGVDYTLASGTVNITAGDTSGNIPMIIINDTLDENNETFIVTLANPLNLTLGTYSVFTYTILDNDNPPTIAFSSASSSDSEGTTSVNIPVSISTASGLNTSVGYSVTGGTATGGGVDYTLASGTATITAGNTSTNIAVTVVNDTLDEANETIIITLANPANSTLGATTEHTYTINDNDLPPSIGFSLTSAAGPESTASINIGVLISEVSGLDTSVNYSVTGGTATGGGVDYTLTSGTATITAGLTSTNIALTIINDLIDEDAETIIITLSNPTNATLAAETEFTYTINDNDNPPTIAFTSASSNGAESATSVSIPVSLSLVSGKNISVGYSVTGGTATGSGTDYTLASGTASIAAGDTSTNIALTVVNDILDEANETIIITLADPTNATLGATTEYTYTINDDDDPPTVGFSSAAGSGLESTTSATATIALSAASLLDVSADYTVSGTATGGGIDYTLANGTASITAGSTSTTVTVSVNNDALVESDETVVITLSNPANATLGSVVSFTYTIVDNDTLTTQSETAVTTTGSSVSTSSTSDTSSSLVPTIETESVPEAEVTLSSYNLLVRVIDSSKQPIANAKVELHSDIKTSYSDENGYAYFASVEPGQHKVVVAYSNYSGEQAINVSGDKEKIEMIIIVEPNNAKRVYWWLFGAGGSLLLVLIGFGIRKVLKSHS